jgi:hypothetical protein
MTLVVELAIPAQGVEVEIRSPGPAQRREASAPLCMSQAFESDAQGLGNALAGEGLGRFQNIDWENCRDFAHIAHTAKDAI